MLEGTAHLPLPALPGSLRAVNLAKCQHTQSKLTPQLMRPGAAVRAGDKQTGPNLQVAQPA